MLVVDVDEEFESVIGHEEDMLPTGVSAEALERLTAIATDLALEREGKESPSEQRLSWVIVRKSIN